MKKVPATEWHPCPRSWHGRRTTVRRVVVHTIEGTAQSALSWFDSPNNPYGTGAHLVISGSKSYQTADLMTILWHARNANLDGVGIEIGGRAAYTKLRWLKKENRRKLRMVGNRIAWLCYTFKLGMPKRGRNVFAHADVPGNPDRTDPGKGFPWIFVMDILARRAYRRLVATNGREWE